MAPCSYQLWTLPNLLDIRYRVIFTLELRRPTAVTKLRSFKVSLANVNVGLHRNDSSFDSLGFGKEISHCLKKRYPEYELVDD